MSKNNDKKNDIKKEEPKKNINFGTLTPLTASQLITLIISINSNNSQAGACGAPCY